MKFEMNGRTYIIKEVSQEELQQEHGEIDGTFFGLTIPMKQEIWLWEELIQEQKKKTLYHELFHCYTFNYMTFNPLEFNEDTWADISANSHDMIHKIVEDYFNTQKN
jgi:hypothetical protein